MAHVTQKPKPPVLRDMPESGPLFPMNPKPESAITKGRADSELVQSRAANTLPLAELYQEIASFDFEATPLRIKDALLAITAHLWRIEQLIAKGE